MLIFYFVYVIDRSNINFRIAIVDVSLSCVNFCVSINDLFVCPRNNVHWRKTKSVSYNILTEYINNVFIVYVDVT